MRFTAGRVPAGPSEIPEQAVAYVVVGGSRAALETAGVQRHHVLNKGSHGDLLRCLTPDDAGHGAGEPAGDVIGVLVRGPAQLRHAVVHGDVPARAEGVLLSARDIRAFDNRHQRRAMAEASGGPSTGLAS